MSRIRRSTRCLASAPGGRYHARAMTTYADHRPKPARSRSSTSPANRGDRAARGPRRSTAASTSTARRPRTLPSFHVWTLGCQMNRSDSEEMAGRLLAAGCEEAPTLDDADLIVINTCAIREAAEQKVIGRQGHLDRLKAANPGMRVVLTGCAVREPDRAGLREALPGGRSVPSPRRRARARRPAGARLGPGAGRDRLGRDDRRRAASSSAPPTTSPATRAGAVATGAVRRESAIERVAADHLRLRQDLHLLHRPVLAGPGAQPAVRRRRR